MKFSVIIPAYQSARYIHDALSSALQQTLPPHEVIVVDDGSSDELLEVIAPFGSDIILLRQENRGPGAARNAGLQRATGDWIALLDADDWWEPTRLEAMQRHVAGNPGHTLITTDAVLAGDARPARYYSRAAFAFDHQREAILCDNFVFVSAALPRQLMIELGGFSEDRRVTEDWDMWIRVILSGATAGLVEAPLAHYRVHPANATSNRLAVHLGDAMALRRALMQKGLTAKERQLARGRLAMALFDAATVSGSSMRSVGWAVARSRTLSPRMRAAGAAAIASRTLSRRISKRH